jgi:hypothetical protein
MKKVVAALFALSLVFVNACNMPMGAIGADESEFDHVESELPGLFGIPPLNIDEASSKSVLPIQGAVYPSVGQKLIIITTTTGKAKDSGTDEADHCYITLSWETNAGTNYSESFVFNRPNIDDLDNGKTETFYYLINVANYVPYASIASDKLVSAFIGNTSKDGWFCQNVTIKERNCRNAIRDTSLPFNCWVDSPSVPTSAISFVNNSSPLGYY